MKKALVYSAIVLSGIALGVSSIYHEGRRRFGPRERVTPGQFGDIYEQGGIENYRWAVQFCKGKHIADMASGSGYGTKILLDGGAASVDGYDYKPLGQKYVLDFEKSGWVKHYDVIVSFDTIEHLANPEFFLHNASKSAPLLLLSTSYGENGGNYFHKQFWKLPELQARIGAIFDCSYQYHSVKSLVLLDQPPTGEAGILAVCRPKPL